MNRPDDTLFVITSSSEKQKKLNDVLLRELSFKDKVITVYDNKDSGIGTGGAVLNIIREYYHRFKKIIIINSGGYSKRSLNYSVRGKAFTHIFDNGKEKTLFEVIAENAKNLSCQFDSGVLICCGDILVNTNNICTDFRYSTGFCIPCDYSTASRHGVMFSDDAGFLESYYHKAPVLSLKQANCNNSNESVLLDTGMLFLNESCANILFEFSSKSNIIDFIKKNKQELCLYSDIVYLLANKFEEKAYYDFHPELKNFKKELYLALKNEKLKVYSLEGQPFIHYGTINETINNIRLTDLREHSYFNTIISDQTHVGTDSVLDNVQLNGSCVIGSHCLITDIVLNDVSIADNTSVCGIKIRDGSYVCIVTSVFENPKAVEKSIPIWEQPRFYKAKSFTQSYLKWQSKCDEKRYSLSYCIEHADYEFPAVLNQYLSSSKKVLLNGCYLQTKNDIIKNHFETLRFPDVLKATQNKVEICMPLRVNLSGTWTDAMPYCTDNGGEMINMAVLVDGNKPVKITLEKLNNKKIEFENNNKTAFFDELEDDELSDFNLHRAVIKTLGFQNSDILENGFKLSTKVEGIDNGSGLGVSSILLAGSFVAINQMFSLGFSKNKIVQLVFAAEQIMGTGGGWQDQIGVLYPGIKRSYSNIGIPQEVDVSKIELKQNIFNIINQRSILIPTGIAHFGKSIVTDVMSRYIGKDEKTLETFALLKKLNEELNQAIVKDDSECFLYCINQHFKYLKQISPLTSNELIEDICLKIKPYTRALSICGAGGGGYLFAVVNENIDTNKFKEIYKSLFPEIKSEIKAITIYEAE